MSRTRALVAGLVTTLAVAGCSGSPKGSPGAPSSSTPSSSASATPSPAAATPPVVPPAPRMSACYRLTARQLTRPTNGSPPVPCTRRHNAQTIYVGRLDTVVKGHSVAIDSAVVQTQLRTTCPRRMRALLGGTGTAQHLSRFQVVWYSPTLSQSDRGADWFRCDLIAFARDDRLAPLPAARKLENVLAKASALDEYGLCGTAAPGTPGFERVICGRPHSWRAVATIPIPGGDRYPGGHAVRTAGDSDCSDLVRSRAEDTLRFRYGWEWPTRRQWTAGQHFGYCWAPR